MKQGEAASLSTTVYYVLLSRVKTRGHKPCNSPNVCAYLQPLQKSRHNSILSSSFYTKTAASCSPTRYLPPSTLMMPDLGAQSIACCVVSRYLPCFIHVMSASKSAYIPKVLIPLPFLVFCWEAIKSQLLVQLEMRSSPFAVIILSVKLANRVPSCVVNSDCRSSLDGSRIREETMRT